MDDALKKTVAAMCSKMIAIGLPGKPYHEDTRQTRLMMETWYESLIASGFTDDDAVWIAIEWSLKIGNASKWFCPADLKLNLKNIRALDNPTPRLPNLSEEQRNANLIKIEKLKAKAFAGNFNQADK